MRRGPHATAMIYGDQKAEVQEDLCFSSFSPETARFPEKACSEK